MTEAQQRVHELSDGIERLRESIAVQVSADGADAHQIDIDRLVWAYAEAEAAVALAEWSSATGDSLAERLACIALERSTLALRMGMRIEAGDANVQHMEAELIDYVRTTEGLGASQEKTLLRSSIRDFARRNIRPLAGDIHRRDLDVPETVIAGASELGLFGLSIPVEYGGSQEAADFESMLIVTEELSHASLSAGGSLITRPEILVRGLLRGGTEEQKLRWLPDIARGAKLVAVAVTEPDYGSDVAAVQCRATRRDDGNWEINGTKLWCTFAGRSELIMVLCRTSDAGHNGLSVFVVEKPAFGGHEFDYGPPGGGKLRGRAIPTIGYRGMHTFELAFERFIVPEGALLGGVNGLNRGFYLQLEGFAMGRIQTAARAVGVMQAAFDDSYDYARSRFVFGKPIAAYQLIRAKLGTMFLLVNASRQLSYRAARLLNANRGQTEAALAKLYASRAAEVVTRDAMQIHGAMGYSEETDVSRYFLDARVLSIFEGAEEILSLRVIGKSLLDRHA